MKTREQTELEAQQEAIKKWAEKKLLKIYKGWWFTRKCRKIQRLAGIVAGDPDAPVSLEIKRSYRSVVKIDE